MSEQKHTPEQYGQEWENLVIRFTKKEIIGLLRAQGLERDSYAAEIERLRAELTSYTALVNASEEFMADAMKKNRALIERAENAEADRAALVEALTPLAEIAKRYHESGLDEIRPEWTTPEDIQPKLIQLYSGRGGRTLLTLQDTFTAMEAIAKHGGQK